MTWQEIWNSYIDLSPGILPIVVRLLCAMLVGLIIGTEREYTHRPAGMRTHILVALGACMVTITGEMLQHQYAGVADPARLSAQVITGVGFLGAGTILREGASVKGLTTAASVWAVACLGIAAGFGYYAVALTGTVFIMLTLTIFEWLQRKLLKSGVAQEMYILAVSDICAGLATVNDAAHIYHATICDIMAQKLDDGHRITFRAEFLGARSKKRQAAFFRALADAPHTESVSYAGSTAEAKL